MHQFGDLVDSADCAVGDFGQLGIDFGRRSFRYPACRFGKLPVDVEAARVDLVGQQPQRMLGPRQPRHATVELALDFDIPPAILAEPSQPPFVFKPIHSVGVFILTRLTRHRHLVHKSFAGGVFAVHHLEGIGHHAKLGWQPQSKARSHSADVPFGWNERKTVARMQDVLLDGGLEIIVMCSHRPVRVLRGFEPF
ncbi:hypothetical protein [Bradyrhizobium sp. JYMT SZCCT0428]|uniref:hypothetical protein n=1 Tax=Bradyrhizobium sp. JYMT SZCCT0428 TaxID=2807673 RepID=UPI001BA6742C|nr:hypothetical protein [Bradyrhizobium sp. JYMT SZCCT0428]MBR1151711.1 hypothetical protein [Bradyrhizobium sp. JYMT SZCCT0428]